ncbi:sensory box/GGDEF family protein [Legionella lansingensis]|uniref:Diguanylate kinase n=1 Tax=Legionella lansingensis TaxID=45067 RepID=A0A0W0W106_9GAMM|nr:GGDEF domain-containing response regulator [Legionella lansingensis]KTD26112.1 Diguanylate kinase [Legionella lansingensis]SNV52609.1 sensory box/GGDEF family protein [Legionella lansingensis]
MDKLNHLLIVDDNIEDQVAYKRYISKTFQQQLSIQTMEKGELALDFLKTNQVDCILLDYQLPDMTGLDFLRKLKDGDVISTPVIMLTGTGNEKIAIEALKIGAYDYLNKGELKPEILYSAIANAVEKSQLIRKVKAKESEINYLAYHDFLTGIPNRAQFETHLKKVFARAQRYCRAFALLLIDLDRFKLINDNYGHETGDSLLKQVARRFQQCLRESDILARLGGDEFAVLADHIEHHEQIAVIAKKLIDALSVPLNINGHKIKTSPSIGIAIYRDSNTTISRMLSNADLALYKAKNSGRNTFRCFSEELTIQSNQQMETENALYDALETQNFYLCYQPIIHIETNQLLGMEVLLRSDHPVLQHTPVNTLIEIANKTGLIIPLGNWILEKTFQQLSTWREIKVSPFKLSINLSINQLAHGNWLQTFQSLINKYHIDPRELIFELAESDMVFNVNDIGEQLATLTTMGCDLLIDNFGAGYSSLNLIRQLPITGVKLDRSFIKNLATTPNDAKMIKAIHLLIRSLDMLFIVTGIETQVQFNILKNHSHLLGQGFYFSKPLRDPLPFLK